MSQSMDTKLLSDLETRGDYAALIAAVRQSLATDRSAALAEPWLRGWIGRRFQSLFLDGCEASPEALAAAAPGEFTGPRVTARTRLANRFLRHAADSAVDGRQPAAAAAHLAGTTLVFCPGLLNGLLPVAAFGGAFPYLEEQYGLRVLAADAHPLRGCDANAADLLAAVEGGLGMDAHGRPIAPDAAVPPGDMVLLGYSKGLPDALHMLRARPAVAKRVRAIVSWAGAAGGSFLADELLSKVPNRRLGPAEQEALIRMLAQPLMPGVVIENMDRRRDEYDARAALEQLRTGYRQEFWDHYRSNLEALDLPWFYAIAVANLRETPYFHLPLSLGVARHDPDMDMQLTKGQATIPLPAAVHLATFSADHWDVAYPAFPPDMRFGSKNLEHPFPKQAGLVALVLLLAELGLIE